MKEAAFAKVIISLVLFLMAGNASVGTADNSWATKASMHVSREGAGAVAVDRLIYVVGGRERFNATDGGFTYRSINATEAYNQETDIWILKAPMPTSRDSFGAVAFQNKVYFFGGTIVTERVRLNFTDINEVYDRD